jgi:hypothetical protein
MIHNVVTNMIPPGIIITGSRMSVLITTHGLKSRPTEFRAKTSIHGMSLPYTVSFSVILFCDSHDSFPPPASCRASRRDFPVEDDPVPPFSTILGNEREMETGATCCKKRKQVYFFDKTCLRSKICTSNKHVFLVTISKHDVTCDKRFFFVTSSFLYQITICDKISVQKQCSSLKFLRK